MILIYSLILLAGIISLLSPILWRPILIKMGVFDIPNHRSSHSLPTVRGGGVAPLTAVTVILPIIFVYFNEVENQRLMLVILVIPILTGVIGLIEDIRGISSKKRALSQLLLGLVFFFLIERLFEINWVWLPILMLFFAANVNFTNFMDGINGLSGFHGLSVGILFSAIGYFAETQWLIFSGLLVAIIFAAFLYWNFRSPNMFLGDVGSYLLGSFTGVIAMIGIGTGINPIAMLAPLLIYWIDSSYTLMVRVFQRMPIFEAHRMHVYQRLTDRGYSHLAISLYIFVLILMTGAAGMLSLKDSFAFSVLSISLLTIIGLLYVLSPMFFKKVVLK